VRAVQGAVGEATFVFRSDVKSYYASINPHCLMGLLRDMIASPVVFELIRGYLQHLVDEYERCGRMIWASVWGVRCRL